VSPKSEASTMISDDTAKARPPVQQTRQMQKELEKTLLQQLKEAEALEKKKKKEMKKEKQ
jgi:hypothetical protein